MKIALLISLLIIAILAFGTRNEAQAVIEDTTFHHAKLEGCVPGLIPASSELPRPSVICQGRVATPASTDYKSAARARSEWRPSSVSIHAAATNAIASINPLDTQADWQTCVMIPNGPIRRPDNYSPSPHSRKADNA